MSIWQRIGAIVGDLATALDPDNWMPGGKDAAFTLALVALSAKMAVADGVVSVSEVRAFRKIVDIPEGEAEQIERFFNLAKRDVAGYRSYARKIRKLFEDSPETLEHVLDGLFNIAAADGMIHEGELEYLQNVGDIFGFDPARFEQISARFLIKDEGGDPYLLLGLVPEASDAEIKRVYRNLVSEHHPDRLMAKGVPEELVEVATARMAAINVAYGRIAKLRRL